ncbi:hypothetical protein BS50DRAFT_295018 [Corynespora cassiicola Philippines]|uniref:Uncharacterized protein n=1 Tax=Corynespora cassiicola Philippines TaxID=1448308 RepID=A0A2T2NWA3_CORCC|nr:hypothetical protein BS50DRAFT_295018 [Corynespora cassiicola Philippines]
MYDGDKRWALSLRHPRRREQVVRLLKMRAWPPFVVIMRGSGKLMPKETHLDNPRRVGSCGTYEVGGVARIAKKGASNELLRMHVIRTPRFIREFRPGEQHVSIFAAELSVCKSANCHPTSPSALEIGGRNDIPLKPRRHASPSFVHPCGSCQGQTTEGFSSQFCEGNRSPRSCTAVHSVTDVM